MAMGTDAGTPLMCTVTTRKNFNSWLILEFQSRCIKISTANAADLREIAGRGIIKEGFFADF
ncbi:MAG: hypothetical protein Ct9H300mP28_11550 [Pseudomonadota bacterium]|nr:MAG: hypothetical protein Ct9H300mP28_11550 [Pseudomonadota bacterium]